MSYDDIPEEVLSSFPSESVEYYFKLWELLYFIRTNPIYKSQSVDVGNGLKEIEYILDPNNNIESSLIASRNNISMEEKDLLLAENEVVNKYFTKVLDLPTFTSKDHLRIRALLKDWYITQRTLVTKSRQAIKPYYLTSPELDELILSFGFPYPYELNRNEKAEFLHHLIEYYKHKGSPGVLGSVLSFFGNVDVVLSEWWLKYIPNGASGNFIMESNPIWPPDRRNDPDLIVRMPYEQFVAGDPLWYYDKPGYNQKIKDLYFEINPVTGERKNLISLPSITPYISLNNSVNHSKYIGEMSILSRKIQESYEYWIEYELNYVGEVSTKPSNPTKNDTILFTTTDTHHVYNGIKWVDLKCKLPQDLLETTPTCPFKPSVYAPRDIKLNISSEINAANFPSDVGDNEIDFLQNFSFFETILGLYYLLGAEYLNGLVRLPNTYNGSPVTIDMLFNHPDWNDLAYDRHIVYIAETKTDWISYKTNRSATDNTPTSVSEMSWIDLGYTVDYTSTSGKISAILFIPKLVSDNPNKNFMVYGGDMDSTTGEYPAEYAPLDNIYIDTMGDIREGCKDGIDDTSYDIIIDEYNNIIKKPEITINNDLYNWSKGDHRFRDAYYSLKDQRDDNVRELDLKFTRERFTEDSQQDSSFLFRPNIFLEAANPVLYYAIYNATYVIGVTYPLDLLRLNRIREIYLNDLSTYLINIGLKNLGAMSSLLIGHSLHENILNIINFFKPYRARFTSFLTDYQINNSKFDGFYANDEFYLSTITQSIKDEETVEDELYTIIHQLIRDGESDVFDAMSRNLFDMLKVTEIVIIKDYMRDTIHDDLTYSEHYVFEDLISTRDYITIEMDQMAEEPSPPVYDVYDMQDAGGVTVLDVNTNEIVANIKFNIKSEYGPNILSDYYNITYSPYNPNLLKGWIELDPTYEPISLLLEDFGTELYDNKEWTIAYYTGEGDETFYDLKSGTIPVETGTTYRVQLKVRQLNNEPFDYNFNVVDKDTEDILEYKVLDEPDGWTDGLWHTIDLEYTASITGDIYIEFFNLQNGELVPVELVSVREKYIIDQSELPNTYWSYDIDTENLLCCAREDGGDSTANIENYYTHVFSDYEIPSFSNPIAKYRWSVSGTIDELEGSLEIVLSSTFLPEGQIYTKNYYENDTEISFEVDATTEAPINSLIMNIEGGNYCKISNFKVRRVFVDVI